MLFGLLGNLSNNLKQVFLNQGDAKLKGMITIPIIIASAKQIATKANDITHMTSVNFITPHMKPSMTSNDRLKVC